MDAQTDPAERPPNQVRLGQCIEEVAAALPQRVDLTASGGQDHFRCAQAFPSGRREAPVLRGREPAGILFVHRRAHHVRAWQGAHLGAALDPAVAPNGHQSRVRTAHVATSQLKVDDGAHVVAAVAVVSNAHAPHDDSGPRLAERLSEAEHVGAREPRAALERVPREPARFGFYSIPAHRAAGDEFPVQPIVLDQVLEDSVKEWNVPANVDLEEVVGDAGSEQGAFGDRRHPVTLHAGLEIRVDQENPGACLLRIVEVLGRDRLVVGGIRAHEHEQVAADPIRIRARGGPAAHGRVQTRGRGRMTDARRVIDVVCSDKTGDLLVGVVGLIGEAPRGEIPRHAARVRRAQAIGDETDRVIPGNAAKPLVALVAHHRDGEPPEAAQLLFFRPAQTLDVLERAPVHRRHGVQAQELQPHGAQVNALHRPVAHPRGAERAAVAAAVAQDAPGVAEVVAVFPQRVQNVLVVVGVPLVEPEGNKAHPVST